MTAADGKFGTGDARTVLPGQPVRYHGGICIAKSIEVQADPSKIVGVFVGDVCSCGRSPDSGVHADGAINGHPFEARFEPEPDYPPIPEPGFYWAKTFDENRWTVVEVTERADGRRFVVHHGDEGSYGGESVLEWGPKLEPPR